MIDRRSQLMCFGFLLSDLALTAAAWLAAYYIRFEAGWFAAEAGVPSFYLCLRQLPLVLLLASVAYRVAGQYDIGRLRRFREETVAVVHGTALMALFAMALIFFLHDPYESRATMVLFWVLTVCGILTARRTGWGVVRTLRSRGYNQTFSLIVGSGRGARRLGHMLMRINWLGIKNVGFVEENTTALSADLDVLGGFADLPELIAKYQVSHVFIALPFNRYDDVRRVFAILSQTMVEVRLVPDVPNLAGLSLTTANLDGLPLIGLRESPHFGLNIVVKRCMDIVLALVALFVLSPVLAIVALLVKLTSPGPIFYRQERCGLNGEPFFMLKFRSMPVDSEQKTGPVWARKGDGRSTPVGRFPAQDQPGRTAAVVERADGRHEPGRPPAGTAGVHRPVQQDDPELHGAAQRQGGHHRLGAGPRLARQHVAAQADPVRPLLHHALDAVAGFPHPVADGVPRVRSQECVLSAHGLSTPTVVAKPLRHYTISTLRETG